MKEYPSQTVLKELFNYHVDGYLIYAIKPNRRIRIGDRAGINDKYGYRRITIDNKFYYEHRLIWIYEYGEHPNCQIDHINRIRDDNRLENLRLCPNNKFDNHQNRGVSTKNKSGKTGVYWHKKANKWSVDICFNKKRMHIGLFDDLNEAVKTRQLEEDKLFNFIRSNH